MYPEPYSYKTLAGLPSSTILRVQPKQKILVRAIEGEEVERDHIGGGGGEAQKSA
jgi:hypothetical protein